jgi:hypothetical protein
MKRARASDVPVTEVLKRVGEILDQQQIPAGVHYLTDSYDTYKIHWDGCEATLLAVKSNEALNREVDEAYERSAS